MDFAPLLKLFSLDLLDLPLAILGAVLFFGLYRTLSSQLFKPYLAHIEAREAATEGALEQATANLNEAKKIEDEFAAKIFSARVAANGAREAVIAKSEKEATRIYEEGAQAEEKVAAQIAVKRTEAINGTKQLLRAQSEQLIGDVTKRVRETLGVR